MSVSLKGREPKREDGDRAVGGKRSRRHAKADRKEAKRKEERTWSPKKKNSTITHLISFPPCELCV